MEIYIPYIIGGSISSILGSVSYYLYSGNTDNDSTNNDLIETTGNSLNSSTPNILHEYSMIDDSLKEKYYYSNNYVKDLGISTNTKFENIIKILNEDCYRKKQIPINNKKQRQKIFRYIQEYENIGHYQFINKYKK